ncbi:histidine decarboxylase isoform X1 [Rhinichthys klamathensis goyatoka]|uniref:histidine decarboxylase isoform X1 n=2 Tax=Rhinichthys klamathensis goyatoka TaxID=3034132 RepID=UPI0024B522AC|nr:histidine decarboxylase isoform X1 [Rhinichthys klamathensis goyatoka]
MQEQEYMQRGKEMVDFIQQYLTRIRERRVVPDVQPGFMRPLLPSSAPYEPEDWSRIMQDVENIIMPGVVHWQSPHMHAYFPALTSWPSLLGDMLADAINCLGFTWASSPACTELEMCVLDWLCKALGLPDHYLHHHPQSNGGGILQSTVSECTLVALLAARKDRILQMKSDFTHADTDESVLNARLIAYASDQAHSSVEKAGLIALLKIRFLETDEAFSLRGETLQRAVEEDRRRGFVPVMLCATLGSTGVCSFDRLDELGPVCAREGLWLHVDAAYAGSALICPELRYFLNGIEFADSFVFNPSKWMMVHFDCTAFWVKNKMKLQQTFTVDPLYLRHDNSDATDFMHWQISLSRRFRSLKLWFVMRCFGLKNLQEHIRHSVEMAKLFESLVQNDTNFQIPAQRHLGLVVFCLRAGNAATQELLRKLTKSGQMFLIPAAIGNKLIIRFAVTSQFTGAQDIHQDWRLIQEASREVLQDLTRQPSLGSSTEEEEQEPLIHTDLSRMREPMIDGRLVRQGQRRAFRSMSCSAELPPARPERCVPLEQIPENRNQENRNQKRLLKVHSVPSLSQFWDQCGIYRPFRRGLVTSRASCLNCLPLP